MRDVPVVLVHGFASSFERNWREPGWVDLLRDEGREVVGVDLLGHGEAAKPHDPGAYRDLERAVQDVLPAEGQADAVGFSLGAQLLLLVAVATPGRFRRMVLGGVGANVFLDPGPEPLARAIETGTAEEGDPPAAQAFARFARAPSNDPAALAACMRRPGKRLRPEQLGTIDFPVLVVLGDRDFAGPAEPLVDALPRSTFVPLSGADHFGTPKDFRFVDAALAFLRG